MPAVSWRLERATSASVTPWSRRRVVSAATAASIAAVEASRRGVT
ncbi:hypothetical protein ACFFMP_11910 [Pseudoroseomonas cervicalis]